MRKAIMVFFSLYCSAVLALEDEIKDKVHPVPEHDYFTYGYGYGFGGKTVIFPSVFGEIGLGSRYASMQLRGGYGIVSANVEVEVSFDNLVSDNISVFINTGGIDIIQEGYSTYTGIGMAFRRPGNTYYRFELTEYTERTDHLGARVDDAEPEIYPRFSFGYRF